MIPSEFVRAGVLGVGDELLYGHTVDTNGAWLGRALSDLGMEVAHRTQVGDEISAIQAALGMALDTVELVVVTGGLGPTPDDLTREAVAGFLGIPLERDPALVRALEDRFRARGLGTLPPTNLAMAQVPRGALVLPNPRGAAPGLVLEASRSRTVILLPGIPGEMRALFDLQVAPFLRERFGPRLLPVIHRFLHTTGIAESVLAQKLAELLPGGTGEVGLAYLPDVRGLRLRLSARAIPGGEAPDRALDRVEEELAPVLLPHRFLSPSGDLAEAVGEALLRADAMLSTAESCTGGLVARRMTDHAGSSRYFAGGVVAYENRVKVEQLGVDPELLDRLGAVSREVAEAMAVGVAARLGTRAGLAVTGIAGPGGGTEEKPVGTVWYAASLDGAAVSRRERFLGDRGEVRERAAQAALHLLLRLLEERPG